MQRDTAKKRNKLFPLVNTISYIVTGLGIILFLISLFYSVVVIVKEDFNIGLIIFIFTLSVSSLIIILGVIARLLSRMIEQNQKINPNETTTTV